jgi:hypothetical protein
LKTESPVLPRPRGAGPGDPRLISASANGGFRSQDRLDPVLLVLLGDCREAQAATGSIRLESLFLTLPARALPRCGTCSHLVARVGGQQRFELRHLGRPFAEPCDPFSGMPRSAPTYKG